MDDPTPMPGGELERALLQALWSRGSATARELFDDVGAPRGIVYTTVAKVLDRLVDKRVVGREREGRAYVYTATIDRAKTQRAMVRTVLEQIVGDDPQPAAAALIGALEEVSPALLDQLAAELAARKEGTE